jgi:hypothetical protein
MRSLVLGLVLLVAAAAIWAVPFVTREQEFTAATPQPDPLFVTATLPLPGGEQACMEGAVVDPLSEVARLRVAAGSPMPLELTVGDGVYTIPPTYRVGQPLHVRIEPPREATETTICVRNQGRRAIELAASDDRTNARRPVEVGGAPYTQNFVITFSEREPRSIADGLPTSLDRASAFRPVSAAVLWPLLALFVLGVPLGVLYAYARAD